MMDENAQYERNVMETFGRRQFAVTHSRFWRLNIRRTDSDGIGRRGGIAVASLPLVGGRTAEGKWLKGRRPNTAGEQKT